MQLEHMVTSLELSRKLKHLGVQQDTFWSWYSPTDVDDLPRLNRTDGQCPVCALPQQRWEARYAAFTVAELGKIIQGFANAENYCHDNAVYRLVKEMQYQFLEGTNEAETRGALLAHVIENQLVTLQRGA